MPRLSFTSFTPFSDLTRLNGTAINGSLHGYLNQMVYQKPLRACGNLISLFRGKKCSGPVTKRGLGKGLATKKINFF